MGNILTAIQAIVENSSIQVIEEQNGVVHNRANQMGAALEDYVKNAFANCLGQDARIIKQSRHNTFSYIGTKNNPPDAMLREGEAIEIKKLESLGTAQLQLNSSFPKNKLHSDNPKICSACRNCEEWVEKDMIYVVGVVKDKVLKNIFFVYGDLYCDSPEIYENVENVIREGIESLEGVELAETKELGRINKVDHLEISDLRIRGMWLIKSPFIHFNYLTEEIDDYAFKLVALIPEDKYNEFENVEEFEEFCESNGVSIADEEIEDPQNPADFINAKIITYYY